MRLIEQKMCDAVLNGKSMSRDNTTVSVVHTEAGEYHSAIVRLHGHELAHYFRSGEAKSWVIRLSDALWRTVTTKSRLNALLEGVGQGDRLSIYQHCVNHETKQHTRCDWFYTMGASRYVWNGHAEFIAKEPNN